MEYKGMEIPIEVKDRREILQKMLEYSSFGGDDIQANLEWLVEDINHIARTMGLHCNLTLQEDKSWWRDHHN